MTVSNLYHRLCPNCREMFTCVSSAGRYCSDRCRNQAYRRRKSLEKDGALKGVPKLYDVALSEISNLFPKTYLVLETMAMIGGNVWQNKYAILAAYTTLWYAGVVIQPVDYLRELQEDCGRRHQQEIFKYIPFEEAS